MAPVITIEPVTAAHVLELSRAMRPEGIAELAACGVEPLAALDSSVRMSIAAWAALADGKVAAIYGVVPFEQPGQGCVWMISGSVFVTYARHFVKIAPAVLDTLLEQVGELINFVDARYGAALRFVRWLGFDIGPAEPRGPHGLLFHPVVVRRG